MLLDWTGRELRADKRGAIPEHLAPILERLGINRANWLDTVRGFGRMFKQVAGRSSSLVDAAPRRGDHGSGSRASEQRERRFFNRTLGLRPAARSRPSSSCLARRVFGLRATKRTRWPSVRA